VISATRKLGDKLTAISLAYLLVALSAIGLTLYMSWQLEGGAAAINQMGSERMRAYRIAMLLGDHTLHGARAPAIERTVRSEADLFERTLEEIERGDPARPLVLPSGQTIRAQFAVVKQQWADAMRPALEAVLAEPDAQARVRLLERYHADTERFVSRIDAVVLSIEREVSRDITLLRSVQFGLIALSVVGTVALIYLMYLLIIRPVTGLREGMRRMELGDFSARLPVETGDELGALAAGFNRMAAHLQDLYASLERRVADKTRSLEQKNGELAALYEMAALLSQPASLDDLCREFLHKLIARLAAQGGAVRLIEADSGKLHLFVHEGLNAGLAEAERCLERGDCLCGQGVQRQHPSVHVLVRRPYDREAYRCRDAGFATVGVFPIRFRDRPLGVFNLYFAEPREIDAQERFMLETLGQHLGIAVENQRLIARAKEMAISEERNLLAEELHDSIAQALAYLNIQAQMLQDSLARGALDSAREELARIREGIQESYDDVRELLVHFRTRMAQSDIESAIAAALERFEAQTGIRARFERSGAAIPLSPETQLQVMHIVQESLSNARKHSGASEVEVQMQRGPVYRFRVRDNGRGFEPERQPSDLHVGLRIMRERAHRIGGALQVSSHPGSGTEVVLTLPVPQQAAA
jgi:two-component system nitrate/nitrite sensor histidine kinase NarX